LVRLEDLDPAIRAGPIIAPGDLFSERENYGDGRLPNLMPWQGEDAMKFKLYEQVALARDIPEKKFRQGDLATVVDYHPVREGEPGYSIEVFNAVGGTIEVTTVPESFLQELTTEEILRVRPLAGSR
jgi:hypothetical protein